MKETILIPSLGGVNNSRVIEVLVKPGDVIEVDAPLITLESDKATMEIPSPYGGKIEELLIKEGDTVSEGDELLIMLAEKEATKDTPVPPKSNQPVKQSSAKASSSKEVYSGPFVRRMAFELGVDLKDVPATGDGGRVTVEDMKNYLTASMPAPAIDFEQWGGVEIEPFSRIQSLSSKHLLTCWQNVPQVTQHHEIDILALEAKRKEITEVRVTNVSILMKAISQLMAENPVFRRGFIDHENVCIRSYHHIGFACETPQGLVVPVVQDVDKKSINELAQSVLDLSHKAREGKLAKDDMSGSVATISSLGGIGGGHFTPIVNFPDAFILGVGRAQYLPRYQGEEVVKQYILPLSLSYDHRLIDGADGARFVMGLGEKLNNMAVMDSQDLLNFKG